MLCCCVLTVCPLSHCAPVLTDLCYCATCATELPVLPVLTVLLCYLCYLCYCATVLPRYLCYLCYLCFPSYHPTSQEGQGLTSAPRLKRAKAEALQVRW